MHGQLKARKKMNIGGVGGEKGGRSTVALGPARWASDGASVAKCEELGQSKKTQRCAAPPSLNFHQ